MIEKEKLGKIKKKERTVLEDGKPPNKLVILPYIQGFSETAARIFKKYNRTVAMKPANTLGQALFKLKDKADPSKKADAIYKIKCKDCPASYIGETSRPLYVRVEEHKKETKKTSAKHFTRRRKDSEKEIWYSSAIAQHVAQTNHTIDWEDVAAIEQVPGWQMRGIKEAIHIRNTPENMNRPQGERHLLPTIWNTILGKPSSQAGRGRGGTRGGHQ